MDVKIKILKSNFEDFKIRAKRCNLHWNLQEQIDGWMSGIIAGNSNDILAFMFQMGMGCIMIDISDN